jgi:AcrR family transcriptional regulator
MTYHYTSKEEREDERFQALRDEYAAEIRQLFNDGWRGQKGLRLPVARYVWRNGAFRDVIEYDVPFPNAVFECLSNDNCMSLLMDALHPDTPNAGLSLLQLREACVEQYLKDNLDDIVRRAWEARDEE